MATEKDLKVDKIATSVNRQIIRHSTDMVIEEYCYKELFYFQSLQRDYLWYVTYNNHLIAFGQYRTDLEQWIDNTYFINEELIKD